MCIKPSKVNIFGITITTLFIHMLIYICMSIFAYTQLQINILVHYICMYVHIFGHSQAICKRSTDASRTRRPTDINSNVLI